MCLRTPAAFLMAAVVPLFDGNTPLEPALVVNTPTALVTRLSDRVRDRHAREAQFQRYDHYLPLYWVNRTISIEIVDRVAKGGSDITVNVTSLWPLETPDFRAFYQGETVLSQYWFNVDMTDVAPVNAQPFMEGRRLHHTDFSDGSHSEPGNPAFTAQQNKLGPRYIARSCVDCHTNNGRALPPGMGSAESNVQFFVNNAPWADVHYTVDAAPQQSFRSPWSAAAPAAAADTATSCSRHP